MKTQSHPETQLEGLPVQSSTPVVSAPQPSHIDHDKRTALRSATASELLSVLRTEAPDLYDRAEIVGKWVWITFPDRQPREVTAQVSQYGFHWNNRRQCWQNPCGAMTEPSPDDPRAKYGSQHPADLQPA